MSATVLDAPAASPPQAPSVDSRTLTERIGEILSQTGTTIPTAGDVMRRLGITPGSGEATQFATELRGRSKPWIIAAANRKASKTVQQRTLLSSPIASTERIDDLAQSDRLLQFVFEVAAADKSELHTAGELCRPITTSKDLLKNFKKAFARRIESQDLPSGVGYLMRRGHAYFFAIDDIRTGSMQSRRPVVEPTVETTPPGNSLAGYRQESFRDQFDTAFDVANGQSKGRNLVPLSLLRSAMAGYDKATFDAEIKKLCQQQVYALSGVEGNHAPIPQSLIDAAIWQRDRRLVYCSRV